MAIMMRIHANRRRTAGMTIDSAMGSSTHLEETTQVLIPLIGRQQPFPLSQFRSMQEGLKVRDPVAIYIIVKN